MEQNFKEQEHRHCSCKESCFKYALIFFATILGAFLAFYFVADYTLKMMFSPQYQMHRAEKMIRDMDKQIEKNINKDILVVGKMVSNPVNISENDKAYVVTIALKPFGNTSKNIKVSVENENILKIEGFNEVKKGNKENMVNMMQSYQLDKNIKADKMTTKEEHGNYVVTLPFDVK